MTENSNRSKSLIRGLDTSYLKFLRSHHHQTVNSLKVNLAREQRILHEIEMELKAQGVTLDLTDL